MNGFFPRVVCVLILAALHSSAIAGTNRLVVHEWGTFTALQDEKGRSLDGINTDDEQVPAFVHRLTQGRRTPNAAGAGETRGSPIVTASTLHLLRGRVQIRTVRIAILILICAASTGCILPARFTDVPGARGLVLDAETHLPINAARVSVSDAEERSTALLRSADGSTPVVETTENGEFRIRPQTHWGVYLMPSDVFPTRGTLVVLHDGYRPLILPIWEWDTVDLGTIYIQKVGIGE